MAPWETHPYRLGWRLLEPGDVDFVNDRKQPFAAGSDVVWQEINSVQAAQAENRIAFPAGAIASVGSADGAELATQDLGEEVAITASRLKEAGVDALALVGDDIEHVVDEFGRREDLAMVDDTLA